MRRIFRVIGAAVLLSAALVLCLRWLPPPTSAFILERQLQKFFSRERNRGLHYNWTAWESISPHVFLAVMASEDQKFLDHWGFDFESIAKAVRRNHRGRRLRGASTITQQVAKNLFLWSGKSYLRKGLEAYFTVLIELLWSKKRVLEVYVNIAEFGDGIYGVGAAAEKLLGRSSATHISRDEAALLAAVLPNPRLLKVRNPSPYVRGRSAWIKRQMVRLEVDIKPSGIRQRP